MARHQIIYTSCKHGIESAYDGQQVFSYDRNFQNSKSDEVRRLFAYQLPSLPSGTVMTEEIAGTMPKSFTYRKLDNGSSAVALNTYLGRDYMGSSGRFGNTLSHCIICDCEDFDLYPCEMFGSPSLRNRMDFDEVNSSESPAYLDEAVLIPGSSVNFDSVVEFLDDSERMEIFKQMFRAMVSYGKDKKRILICDTEQNTIMWIAALQYGLPLSIAKTINFTTYEYNPEMSPSQICGVQREGTKYNSASFSASNYYYVFDMYENLVPDISGESPLTEFLEISYEYFQENISLFNSFVEKNTTLRECNAMYDNAYELYAFLTGEGFSLNEDSFGRISDFVNTYVTEEIKKQFVQKVLKCRDEIFGQEDSFVYEILAAIMRCGNVLNIDDRNNVKQLLIDKLLQSLAGTKDSQEKFVSIYENLDSLARAIGISIPAELMQAFRRDILISNLKMNPTLWKMSFILRITNEYVKDTHISTDELYIGRPIGKIYSEIITLVYRNMPEDVLNVVTGILDVFKTSLDYYVNIEINLETILEKNGVKDMQKVRSYFLSTIAKMNTKEYTIAVEKLNDYDLEEYLYALYKIKIEACSGYREASLFFTEYISEWNTKNPEYARKYLVNFYDDLEKSYEKNLSNMSSKETDSNAMDLLEKAKTYRITGDCVDTVCDRILVNVPFSGLRKEDKAVVSSLYKYRMQVAKKPMEGKLLLIFIAVKFNEMKKGILFSDVLSEIRKASGPAGANLAGLTEKELNDYYSWVFKPFEDFSLEKDDYVQLQSIFSFTNKSYRVFLEYWCEKTLHQSIHEKDVEPFSEYICFLSGLGREEDASLVAGYIRKLNKQKMEGLDAKMNTALKRKKRALEFWKDIMTEVSSSKTVFGGLSGLFHKK